MLELEHSNEDDRAAETEALLRRIAELSAALEARDEYMAVVGHELRNIVAPMVLLGQQLELDVARPDAPQWIERRAAVLTRSLRRFVDALHRITDVARLSHGRVELVLEDVNLGTVVSEICAQLASVAAAAGAEIVPEIRATVIGSWDRLRLEQITYNLVSNAIRYGEGSRVDVQVIDDGGCAELSVRDRGPGIDVGEQERIFGPFERVGPRRSGGLGVGLWVVRTLCAAMQGSVRVESRPGDGACFRVSLPKGSSTT